MNWVDLTERLARELAGLEPQMVLVVHQKVQGSHYVQAFRTGETVTAKDMVHAEAVSSAALSSWLRFAPEAEQRLEEIGWERPEEEGNWTCDLTPAASSSDFRALAEMMVFALRDVQRAGAPQDLAYEAFRGSTFLSLPELGLDPAHPERVGEKHIASPLDSAHDLSTLPAPKPKRNKTAIRLAEAKANSDRDGYLEILQKADLYVAGTVVYSDGIYIKAFTAPPPEPHKETTLQALAEEWPQPHWQLAIDDGHPDAAYLDSLTIGRLAGTSARLVMQKVLPHPLVVHYLEGGYDRVAGYVHRVADVLQLSTPKQMYAALGLGHGNSPFSPEDDSVHVLRWHTRFGDMLRTPYGGPNEPALESMPGGWVIEHPPFDGTGFAPGTVTAIPEFKVDSMRLPHGAEIYRYDRSGKRTLVAIFDADGTRWVAM